MSETIFRPAVLSDCPLIARLYSIASDGVADYVWSNLAEPGEDILDVGRRRYEREGTAFSYTHCTIAVRNERVAGMLVAFPMHVDHNADPEDDPVLRPYAILEEDASYYICGVALFPEFRGQGIGSWFMNIAEDDARKSDFTKTSLLVFEQNAGARRLYDRLGYREVAREKVVPHPLIKLDGDVILMVKDLR